MTEPPTDQLQTEPDRQPIVTTEVARRGGRLLTFSVAGALVCAFLVVDFLTPRRVFGLGDREWLLAALSGICIGQANLIAVWASFGRGNIVIRLSMSFLLTMAMVYALIVGYRAATDSYWRMTRSDTVLLMVVLPISVGVLQIPLWIAKKVFGWRLVRRPSDDASDLEDRQFHLRHLLMATVFVSMALSPLHTVLPSEQSGPFRAQGEIIAALVVMILCNLTMTIPCLWWAFARLASLTWVIVGWLFYCCALTAVEFGGLCALFGSPGRSFWIEVAHGYVSNLSQSAAILVTLLVFRALGFCLVRMPPVRNR